MYSSAQKECSVLLFTSVITNKSNKRACTMRRSRCGVIVVYKHFVQYLDQGNRKYSTDYRGIILYIYLYTGCR